MPAQALQRSIEKLSAKKTSIALSLESIVGCDAVMGKSPEEPLQHAGVEGGFAIGALGWVVLKLIDVPAASHGDADSCMR